MSSKLKEIKRILKEHDVRDPRGCLRAIEDVINSERSGPKPVLKLEVIDHGHRGELIVKSLKTIEAKHVGLAIDGLRELAINKAAECEEGCRRSCWPTCSPSSRPSN
jgi:hypothetical protein